MIAGPRSGALSRRRGPAPWIVILLCVGLCLGWHPGGLGLPAERPCAEAVTSDPYPLDERPAVPLSHVAAGRRDTRAPAVTPPRVVSADPVLAGRPVPGRCAGGFPVAPPAGAHRLILLGVSRI
ncbi:hypothetical protein GCM10017673_07330 [Streptosporangium violaceochromogenes]|nr:hypothetical protein GCM10017673_07330 [Streptosporangium violaceochromogenes]